eukprot:m.59295 g.59295  ORF g.59295 m.59295 type:complete len:166 (+) comp34880_c0_seq6:289-786(+)
MVLFSFKGASSKEIVLKPAPYVYLGSIWTRVTSVLDVLDRHPKLTWHDGCIPEDQVWIKIGGDSVGGSFKLSFQLGNVERVNSVRNTFPICCFAAGDSVANLQVALKRFHDQVNEIKQLMWNGKSVDLFVFGDYDFLSKIYGISGAAGRHPCLWCTATKRETQVS